MSPMRKVLRSWRYFDYRSVIGIFYLKKKQPMGLKQCQHEVSLSNNSHQFLWS